MAQPYTTLAEWYAFSVSINIFGTPGINYFSFSDRNVLYLRSELSWQINPFKSFQEISHVNVNISTTRVDLVNDHTLLVCVCARMRACMRERERDASSYWQNTQQNTIHETRELYSKKW
jgi:hypothetical protein